MSAVNGTGGAGDAAAAAAAELAGDQDEYPSYNDAVISAWRALEKTYNGQNAIAVGLAEGKEYIELMNLLGTVTHTGYAVTYTINGTKVVGIFDTEAKAQAFVDRLKTDPRYTDYKDAEYLGFRFIDTKSVAPKQSGEMIYWAGGNLDQISIRTSENVAINAKDGLSTGELYSVGRSGSNTETFVEALLLMMQKVAEALKNMLKTIVG